MDETQTPILERSSHYDLCVVGAHELASLYSTKLPAPIIEATAEERLRELGVELGFMAEPVLVDCPFFLEPKQDRGYRVSSLVEPLAARAVSLRFDAGLLGTFRQAFALQLVIENAGSGQKLIPLLLANSIGTIDTA